MTDFFDTGFPQKTGPAKLSSDKITRLKRRAMISDSIVIVRPPSGTMYRIFLLNRFLKIAPSLILRGKISPNIINEIKKEIRDTAVSSWLILAKVYPFAFTVSLSYWRHFNDSFEEKLRLIEQYQRDCHLIIPVCDEIGMVATVVKHLCLVRRKLRWTVDMEIISVLKEVGEKLLADLENILSSKGILTFLQSS